MEIVEEIVTNDNNEQITLYKVNHMIFSSQEAAQNYIDTHSSNEVTKNFNT